MDLVAQDQTWRVVGQQLVKADQGQLGGSEQGLFEAKADQTLLNEAEMCELKTDQEIKINRRFETEADTCLIQDLEAEDHDRADRGGRSS